MAPLNSAPLNSSSRTANSLFRGHRQRVRALVVLLQGSHGAQHVAHAAAFPAASWGTQGPPPLFPAGTGGPSLLCAALFWLAGLGSYLHKDEASSAPN